MEHIVISLLSLSRLPHHSYGKDVVQNILDLFFGQTISLELQHILQHILQFFKVVSKSTFRVTIILHGRL